MAEFYTSLSSLEIANQIAEMLNTHNRLKIKHYGPGVATSTAKYFIELDRDKVVGCVAIIQETPNLSKLLHGCVRPEYRKHGIARKLMKIAMDQCKTSHVYGTIREDNVASLAMVRSLGFVFVKKEWQYDHNLITVGRRLF